MIGNLSGDLVKGPLGRHSLHPRVADGVRRHRRVDGLTDSHPEFRHLLGLFPRGHRRFAGIVLDVYFDHLLSMHWRRFCSLPRREFLDAVYRTLSDNPALLPPELAAVAGRWVSADWLDVYASREGIDAVLGRVSRRFRRPAPLQEAASVLDAQPQLLERHFLTLFADVQAVVNGQRAARWLARS